MIESCADFCINVDSIMLTCSSETAIDGVIPDFNDIVVGISSQLCGCKVDPLIVGIAFPCNNKVVVYQNRLRGYICGII